MVAALEVGPVLLDPPIAAHAGPLSPLHKLAEGLLLEDIAEPGLGRLLLLRPGDGVEDTDLILRLKLRKDLGRRRHLQPGTVDVLR